MATFKKRKNGYQAQIYIGKDENGKKMYEWVTRPTLKECKEAAMEIELSLKESKLSNVRNMRFSSWCDKWLELNEGRLSPSTYKIYTYYINAHYKPYFKDTKLKDITELQIKDFINQKSKKLSQSTVHKLACVLNEILREALKERSPMKDIEIPPNECNFKPYVPNNDEFQRMLDYAHKKRPDRRDEIIILLGAKVGLRRGEIFALKRDDLFEKTSEIRIDESRVIGEEGYVDSKPKSKKSYRIVQVPQYIFALIREYLSKQTVISERLFDISPNYWTHYFARMMDEIGLPQVRFHDLRHYRASTFYLEGIPDQYVAGYLGHDIVVLKQIYQHLDFDTDKRINEQIKKGLL
jgi:integrase